MNESNQGQREQTQYRQTKRQLKLIYFLSLYNWNEFLLPIWFFFYTQTLGMSAFQATFLATAQYVFQILLEVPTGVIADTQGRVVSFRWGLFFACVWPLLFFVTSNFYVLLISAFISGLSGALCSGSLQPFAKSLIEKTTKTRTNSAAKIFDKYILNMQRIGYISRAILAIVGQLLYAWQAYLPLIATLVLSVIIFIFSFKLQDFHIKSKVNLHLKSLASYIKQSKSIKYFLVLMPLLYSSSVVAWMLPQPFSEYLNISKGVFSVYLFLASFSAVVFLTAIKQVNLMRLIFTHIIFRFSLSLILVLHNKWLFLLSFAFVGIPGGIFSLVEKSYVQRNIPMKFQSSVLSVASAFDGVFYFMGFISAGYLIDKTGVGTTVDIVFVYIAAAAVIAALLAVKLKNLKKL